MRPYHHCVAGFFGDLTQAQATQAQLIRQGLPQSRLQIFHGDSRTWVSDSPRVPEAGSRAALKAMLVDGAIGGAAGVGLGALTEWALVATNVSLFAASPVLAPLLLMGWGAALGGTIGALVGADKKEGPLSAVIRDAVGHDQIVLVADTETPRETTIARNALQAATGDFKDVRTDTHKGKSAFLDHL